MPSRTSPRSHVGCAWISSAATPATCGDAIDVPLRNSPPVPDPNSVEKILTPGALTSGLKCPSPPRGPVDEKVAIVWYAASGRVVLVRVTAVDTASSVPSAAGDPRMLKNGMVTPGIASSNGE